MKLLARGRDCDVFDLGDGRVLRRYRRGGPARKEALVMAHARAHGFPAPRVDETTEDEIVMERLVGPTMLEDLRVRLWRALPHARTLARLHRELHRIAVPRELTTPFGDGVALLHLDLHPANVILAERGPVVIDWTNAARGPAEADVALTYVILATATPPGSFLQRAVIAAIQDAFVREFLRPFDRAAVRALLPRAAELRLADRNVTEGERASIRRLIRA